MNKLAEDDERPASRYADTWERPAALLTLRELIAAAQRMRHAVARRAGLSESELAALQHLLEDPLGPADLSRRLEVSTPAGTQIADRLVGRGHVERVPDPDDRRRTRLVVTPSGREEVLAHLLPMFTGLEAWDAGFDDAERAVVERYLRGVVEVFERVVDPPEPS